MCASVAQAYKASPTIIINDNSDNRMRHSKFVQNSNDPFGVNELNWRKKLSSPANYQHQIDKNQALRARSYCGSAKRTTPTNWINIRRVKAIRANRRSLPIHTTHSDSEHRLTILDVQFEWNSRIYFSISSKIYSR